MGGANLANGSVGTAQLAPLSVTSAKLATGSVGANQLADNSVTGPKIPIASIDFTKIVDGAGSGLDSDLLDGLDSSKFLRSDASDSFTTGTMTFNSTLDVNGTLRIGQNDGSDDDFIYFDQNGSQYLQWNDQYDRFVFSSELRVNGPLNVDSPAGGIHSILFDGGGGQEYFRWNANVGVDRFELSHGMEVEGSLILDTPGSNDEVLYFQGNNGLKSLRWDDQFSRFLFSNHLRVNGPLNIHTGGDIHSVLFSGGSGQEHFRWNGTAAVDRFELSDGLKVEGSMILDTPGGNDEAIYFQGNNGLKALRWDHGDDRFEFGGKLAVDVLTILGGADIVEPFENSQPDQAVESGSLMVIDADNPGQLKMSNQAYDHCVAGIVSGAGGVKPGLRLSQEGVLDGEVDIAMTGRVYARATTENGPIRPGDLLTTSNQPGHAMKATDRTKSHGTIIGKAMTPLEDGEGLVLVLVNLQ